MYISAQTLIDDLDRKKELQKKAIRARGLQRVIDRHAKNGKGKSVDECVAEQRAEAVQICKMLEATGRKDWHDRFIAFQESGADVQEVQAWIDNQTKLTATMAEIEAEVTGSPTAPTPPPPANAPLYGFTMVGTNHAAEIDAARNGKGKS